MICVSSNHVDKNIWTGLSTDTKPASGTRNAGNQSPLQNDLFFETDTGNWFIFANLAWKAYGQDSFMYIWQPSSLTWIKATADASGNLNVVSAGGGGATNITQVAGVTLGATAVVNYGTTPAAVAVPAVNAFVTNTVGVSGTVTTTPPANASTNVAQVAGVTLGATAVTNYGTAPAAAAVPGVNAFVTNTVAVSGTVTTTPPANASTNVAQVAGTTLGATAVTNYGTTPAAAAVPGVNAFVTNAVTVAQATPANLQATVTPIALTKGTQGATGFSVQDLKDAGRVAIVLYANNVAAGATGVETAITLTKAADTAATTTGVSFVITNGKRFRISSITVASRGNATATAQITTFALRINTAGAVVVTSTPLVLQAATATPATASAWDRFQIPIPDGLEYLGNGTVQFGLTANSVFVTNAPTWFVTITGFEY